MWRAVLRGFSYRGPRAPGRAASPPPRASQQLSQGRGASWKSCRRGDSCGSPIRLGPSLVSCQHAVLCMGSVPVISEVKVTVSSRFGAAEVCSSETSAACWDSEGEKHCERRWDFNMCPCISVLQLHPLILLKSPLYTPLIEPFHCRNNGGQKGDQRADGWDEGLRSPGLLSAEKRRPCFNFDLQITGLRR